MFRRLSKGVKKFWAGIALLSVEMTAILGIFVLALIVFVYLVRRVFVLQNNGFDQKVFDYLGQFVTPFNNKLMLGITFLGKHEFLIPANLLLIAYFLFVKKHKWYSIRVPAIALSSLALMFILKNLFGRERPLIPLLQSAKGLSFPSGHALMSMTFYGLLIYITWHSVKNKNLKWTLIGLLFVLILLIGFSRIYLRVHYTSDVLAGFAMGWLWIVVSLKVIRQIEKQSKKQIDPIVQQPPAPPAGMISVNNITLSFGKRVLFDEVKINFVKGNCYGVIGANGAGKSTFLKILSGEIEPNKGTVDISPASVWPC
jgi:membrane-associated phospholipid phosphatase